MSGKFIYNTLNVNLEKIVSNFNGLKNFVGNKVEMSAIVKANAYGLGVDEVINALSLAGCNKFFVYSLDEAIVARKNTMTDEIIVFSGIFAGQESDFMHHNITPVLNTTKQIDLWLNHAMKKGVVLPAILQIDTGMTRLGIDYDEAILYLDQNLERISVKLDIKYIMSHLACAEIADHTLNKIQLEKVIHLKNKYKDLKFSLANSAGIFLGEEYHFDLVRPGAALYGFIPNFINVPFINEVAEYYSTIAQIRNIETDSYVGYDATRFVAKGTVLAVINAGYADGYFRALSNIGYCYIDEYKCPIVGKISMDSTVIDVTNVPKKLLYEGAPVELLGPNYTIENISKMANVCGWEVLTLLGNGKRYTKITC